MKTTISLLLVIAAGGCAHDMVSYRNGCWVRTQESRIGDTKELVSVCEPRAPKWADDPMARAVDSCHYQAQLALYNDSVQRLRTGKPPPTLEDWAALTRDCSSTAQKMAEGKIRALEAEVDMLKRHNASLESEENELRDALISCAEKSPNAVAEAKATTESSSDSDAASKDERRTRPAIRRTDIQHTAGREACPPVNQAKNVE